MSNTLNYLNIKTVLTSCGTCIDQLLGYQFEKIFVDSRLIDIHEYLLEKNVTLKDHKGRYLYHEPCHNPIKTQESSEVIAQLMGQNVVKNDRCCAEAGTFAIERSDIAKQVGFRKENEIKKDLQKLPEPELSKTKSSDKEKPVNILTTCPACRQGLSRYQSSTGVVSRYPIEILVENKLGVDWQKNFIETVNIERVLL